jgi:hypothetical protein
MPHCTRRPEIEFLNQILFGLAETDATILCLLPAGAAFRRELELKLADRGRSGQVTLIDPMEPRNRVDARFRAAAAKIRARRALEQTIQILEPYGLRPGSGIAENYLYIANLVEAWERMEQYVEFDSVVTRCHWHALCSPVCRTGLRLNKPVITFQQGVITHTLEAPVTASTYVAFGQSSATFLDKMNHSFFKAIGITTPQVRYISGGSLYDNVTRLPDQFEMQSLLVVDVPTPSVQADFYGLRPDCEALLDLVDRLLTESSRLKRVIIRPHPFWNDLNLEACHNLIRSHPCRCELSHPSWPLDFDLQRSSAVLGIFSGVLTISSACGLPTIFLRNEKSYATGDLTCFVRAQTFSSDAAFLEITEILSDRKAYSRAREEALRNAREYYANGSNLNLNGSFFNSLLSTDRPQRSGRV